MTQKHDTDTINDDLPEYLEAVIDEAEEFQRLEPNHSVSRVAESVAYEQQHLINSRFNEPSNLEVLQDLRELGVLSAYDLGMHCDMTPSYDHAESTIEALVIASLSRFLREYLEESGE